MNTAMKKLATLLGVTLLTLVSAKAATVYSSNFEPNSQGSSFTNGPVNAQGTPAWGGFFLSGYDGAGSVVSDTSNGGTQSLNVAGYQTSYVTLASPVQNQWFEFAFKPNFGGTAATTWALTTIGGKSDTWGIKMGLSWDGSVGTVYVGDIGAGVTPNGIAIGNFTNGEWQTISFQTDNAAGAYDVFLGSNNFSLGTFEPAGFTGVQTLVFSSATQSWVGTGNWNIDGINVGSDSIYVVPEPSTYALVLGGIATLLLIRRRVQA
jgi:hypothetical protein